MNDLQASPEPPQAPATTATTTTMKFLVIFATLCLVSAMALPLDDVHHEKDGQKITIKKVGDKIIKKICETKHKIEKHTEYEHKEVKDCHDEEVCKKVPGWVCEPLDKHDPHNHSKKCDPKKECHHEKICKTHHVRVPHVVRKRVPFEHCEEKIFELKHSSSSHDHHSSSHHRRG